MGVAHVVHTAQTQAKSAAVVDHASERHAAHVHAVISPLARDKDLALRLAAHAVVGQGHLHGRVDGLTARVDKKHAVNTFGGVVRDALGELERFAVRAHERRREIQGLKLLVHGVGNLLAAVAGSDTEQAGRSVDHFAAVGRVEVHALGAGKHARLTLEFFVCRERHPERFQSIGDLWFCVTHGVWLLNG